MIDEDALRSIERLHKMKNDGIISDDEFDAAKQQLLRPRVRTKNFDPQTFKTPIILPEDNDPVGWTILGLKRFSDFEGRSCRREYWMFQIIYLALGLFVGFILSEGLHSEGGFGWIASITMLLLVISVLVLFLPLIALQVRRFHDQDKTGWFALLNFVPYLGPFIIMGFMLIDGTPGDNQYGPDPKDR